jgi:hypothetical protein
MAVHLDTSYWLQYALLVAIMYFVWRNFVTRRGGRPIGQDGEDLPILAANQLLDSTDLQSVHKDVTSGFKYNFLVSGGGAEAIFIAQLRHDTHLHVLGFGAKSGRAVKVTKQINARWLKQVRLEGDFSTKFNLYCTPGKETKLLEVFTPDVMSDFADFCQAYDLEIFRESLYISQPQGAFDTADRTALVTDVEKFLATNNQLLNRL